MIKYIVLFLAIAVLWPGLVGVVLGDKVAEPFHRVRIMLGLGHE